MNVYDFDGTIYAGDSSVDFYLYCLRRNPRLLVYIFRQIKGVFLHAAGRCSTARMKEYFFSFLAGLDDPDACARAFWKTRSGHIQGWYLAQKAPGDVVISASPEFLLRPVCEQLGAALIATQMDIHNGRIQGENCKGEEKVRRFAQQFPDGAIERFYSDSQADAPLAGLAGQAFFVKKGVSYAWPQKGDA